MISRQDGRELVLITQHEHAQLSGALAERIGNGLFAPPSPFELVVHAIAEHDCGWAEEDSNPSLDHQGQPATVFESDIMTSIAAWERSVEKVIATEPYAGLLVSLHTMALANHIA